MDNKVEYTEPDMQVRGSTHMISADEIFNKYLEIYPLVEKAVGEGLYKQGLDLISEHYDKYNIPGDKAAAYIMQYVSSTVGALVANSQQAALNLVSAAYQLPLEMVYKSAQTKTLNESLIHNILIKLFDSQATMIGSLGAGGLVASYQQVKACFMTLIKTLESVKSPDGERLFDDETIKVISARYAHENDDVDLQDMQYTKRQNNIGV